MAKLVKVPEKTPVPENWTWIEMGKLVDIKNGFPFDSKLFSKNANGKLPLIRIRDIVRGYTETYTDEVCPEEYTIKKGDILIGMDGDFNVASWKGEDALLNQRVCCIESASPYLNRKFLLYYLPTPLTKINEATPSVTVKHLSTKTLSITPIPIPPIAEQQRIVDRIDSLFAKLDEAKEKVQEALESFESRKNEVLHRAFSGELTEGWRKEQNVAIESWESKHLKDCCTIGSGGTPSRKHNEYYNGSIPWIKTGEILWNAIYDSEEKISTDAIENSTAKIYPIGTVVVAMYGQGLTRGRAAILEVAATTNQAVCALQPHKDLTSSYLYYYFMANYWNYRVRAVGGNQPNYSATMISRWIIHIPSLSEQTEIVRILDDFFSKEAEAKEKVEATLEAIDMMKKSILDKTFRGELGTNKPEDESAEELLK